MGYPIKSQNPLMAAALGYARGGWPVLPLAPCGKSPLTQNGYKDATLNLNRVEQWWRKHPQANIGLAVPEGLFVVDIDSPGALYQLNALDLVLPSTVTATTGRGRHLWYSTAGVRVGNTVNLFEGIDIRGVGGYVVAPPSIHNTGVVYEWSVDLKRESISEAPQWLMEKLAQPSRSKGPIGGRPTNRQNDWADFLSQTYSEGSRNHTLARVAGYLLTKHPAMAAKSLAEAWAQTHLRPPLPRGEVERTIDSIAARELARRKGGRS